MNIIQLMTYATAKRIFTKMTWPSVDKLTALRGSLIIAMNRKREAEYELEPFVYDLFEMSQNYDDFLLYFDKFVEEMTEAA